ncbi:MAG: shikimate kinase [Oscillospiraceae bacterium]|jgi:shikimate kinase|nr:shikimate kinase [Oscillospiraceae bacterium]
MNSKNIVFIGMPGCGKSAVARAVASRLGRKWYDSDVEIEASEGIGVPEIFKRFGEEYFRRLETETLLELSSRSGAVISAGGGAVARNAGLLRRNAVVVYLERTLEDIAAAVAPGSRPLLKDPGSLRELYGKRRVLYEDTCDLKINNSGSIEETAERVLEALR